jgi:hypothetical protein
VLSRHDVPGSNGCVPYGDARGRETCTHRAGVRSDRTGLEIQEVGERARRRSGGRRRSLAGGPKATGHGPVPCVAPAGGRDRRFGTLRHNTALQSVVGVGGSPTAAVGVWRMKRAVARSPSRWAARAS